MFNRALMLHHVIPVSGPLILLVPETGHNGPEWLVTIGPKSAVPTPDYPALL
jgi:hypothetical protein